MMDEIDPQAGDTFGHALQKTQESSSSPHSILKALKTVKKRICNFAPRLRGASRQDLFSIATAALIGLGPIVATAGLVSWKVTAMNFVALLLNLIIGYETVLFQSKENNGTLAVRDAVKEVGILLVIILIVFALAWAGGYYFG